MLATSTDHTVIASKGIKQGSNDTSNGTDSISHELNEAMDIDSLVTGARKKHKTNVGAVRISFTNEEDRNNIQLECQNKRKSDHVGVITTVVGTPSPRNSQRELTIYSPCELVDRRR